MLKIKENKIFRKYTKKGKKNTQLHIDEFNQYLTIDNINDFIDNTNIPSEVPLHIALINKLHEANIAIKTQLETLPENIIHDYIDKSHYEECMTTGWFIQHSNVNIEGIIRNDEPATITKSPDRYKKTTIPPKLRSAVWEKYCGKPNRIGKCFCCNQEIYSDGLYHCGHIIPEAKGGKLYLDNLRPVCLSCNSSMGCLLVDDPM